MAPCFSHHRQGVWWTLLSFLSLFFFYTPESNRTLCFTKRRRRNTCLYRSFDQKCQWANSVQGKILLSKLGWRRNPEPEPVRRNLGGVQSLLKAPQDQFPLWSAELNEIKVFQSTVLIEAKRSLHSIPTPAFHRKWTTSEVGVRFPPLFSI